MRLREIREIGISDRRRVPFEISLREKPLGGAVRASADERPIGLVSRARRLVLLIHGYNVTLCSAGCSYDSFKHFLSLGWAARSVAVYWPGDAETNENGFWPARVISKVTSAMSYPLQIEHAKEAARVLRTHIAANRLQSAKPLELNIVAHSLGCRLALQLIDHLRTAHLQKTISIRLVVLMAAAVPVYFLRPRRELREALETPDQVLVYHSRSDKILSSFFRSGQALESPFPYGFALLSRRALGLRGLDRDQPTNVEEIPTEHDHGDYWPDESIAQRVSTELDGSLRAQDIARPLQRRQLPGRRVIDFRDIANRTLTSSTVGLRAKCGTCP